LICTRISKGGGAVLSQVPFRSYQKAARRYIEEGKLWRVPHAPQFKLPAWMVFPRDSDNATLKNALDGLRQLAREEQLRDN
jgi:hypothetical protein